MVATRRVPYKRADVEGLEPLLDVAKRRVAREGGNLRLILRELRDERRLRAETRALAEAPPCHEEPEGTFQRVSADPRWPFGVRDNRVVAPFGFGVAGLPRTLDPGSNKAARNRAQLARREARELISQKLERLGCDPIAIMAELAMDKSCKDEVRLRAAAELATMMYPRLKSVESTRRDEKTIFVIGVPSERPANSASWLQTIGGPAPIDVESRVVEDEPEAQHLPT